MIPPTKTVVLLALLLVSSGEDDPQYLFKAAGEKLELGFCFGGYIVVYRMSAGGRELLGNSSSLASPPEAFKHRLNITNDGLYILKIHNLRASDSGIYVSECWSDNNMKHSRKHHLQVCDQELNPLDILLTPRTGAALMCDVEMDNQTTLKWYRQTDNATLFLDTKISQQPLQEEFNGLVVVRHNGSLLRVSDNFVNDQTRFFCLAMVEDRCRSFQMIRPPEETDGAALYAAEGEHLTLRCSVDHLRRNYWKTPFGRVNSSRWGSNGNLMLVPTTHTDDYTLLVPSLTSYHSGTYQCVSTFLMAEYRISMCVNHSFTNLLITAEQKTVVLELNFQAPSFTEVSVLWYRRIGKEDVLLLDSGEASQEASDDAKHPIRFSEKDFSLTVTDLAMEDAGMYWAVVLLDQDEMVVDDVEYFDDEVDQEEDELPSTYEEEEYMEKCLFKQVIKLKIQTDNHNNPRMNNVFPSEPTASGESDTSVVFIIVAVCVVAVVVLVVVGVVIGVKKRASRRENAGQCEEGQALNTKLRDDAHNVPTCGSEKQI